VLIQMLMENPADGSQKRRQPPHQFLGRSPRHNFHVVGQSRDDVPTVILGGKPSSRLATDKQSILPAIPQRAQFFAFLAWLTELHCAGAEPNDDRAWLWQLSISAYRDGYDCAGATVAMRRGGSQ
jgi:hypothetical protein